MIVAKNTLNLFLEGLPSNSYILEDKKIHIWYQNLDNSLFSVKDLVKILSLDEKKRVARFYFQRDQVHFIVSRGLLRILIGGYLSLDPAGLRFQYGAHGKPILNTFSQTIPLHFNLSHSDGLGLYAFALGEELGVDLEKVHEDFQWYGIAERLFSAHERAILWELPISMRKEEFFTLWTYKEAYIKARGNGFSIPFDHVDLSPAISQPERVFRIRDIAGENTHWSFFKLIPSIENYVAAIAIRGLSWQLQYCILR